MCIRDSTTTAESVTGCHDEHNNLKLDRKWATNNQYILMAASGQTFGNSRPGIVPTWIPEHVAAQPPARHGPCF
eukprot:3686406-Pyramimonas_sp.AAC.1